MAKKDMSLEDVINAAIDARLEEHGLLESGKGGKGGKDDKEEITLKDLTKLAKKMDEDDLKKALKKLKAKKLSEIDEDDYAEAAKLFGGDEEDDDEVTIDSLKEKFVELMNEKGKKECKGVLKKLKVETLAEVDEDDFDKAMGLIKKALGEGEGTDAEDLFGK